MTPTQGELEEAKWGGGVGALVPTYFIPFPASAPTLADKCKRGGGLRQLSNGYAVIEQMMHKGYNSVCRAVLQKPFRSDYRQFRTNDGVSECSFRPMFIGERISVAASTCLPPYAEPPPESTVASRWMCDMAMGKSAFSSAPTIGIIRHHDAWCNKRQKENAQASSCSVWGKLYWRRETTRCAAIES